MTEPIWHHEDVRSEYTIVKELGSGQFGTCFLVVHRGSGCKYACKSINKHAKSFNRLDVEREVQILAALSGSPNVVELSEVWEDSHSIHIVQELCEGGELFDVIVDRGHLSERDAAVTARTLLEVVGCCHGLSILHRDLKPENWLLKSALSRDQPLESHQLRAIDFGLSVFLPPEGRLKTLAGSSYYMAPEVLKGNYGMEADLWSCGVIIYIILCGLPPFWGSTEKQIFRRILHEPLDLHSAPWPELSANAKDIVSRLLTRDVKSRMTLEEALAHPWISEYAKLPDVPLSSAVFCRLRRFRETTKLKGLLLNVVAKHLPPESITALREMFTTMDKNRKGTIKVDELRDAVQKLGKDVDQQALQEMVSRLDIDHSGEIEYEEFLAAAINRKQLVTEQSLAFLFAQLDRDDDGLISLDELHDIVKECGGVDLPKEQLQELLVQEAGLDAAQAITPAVFKKLMYDLARDDLIPGCLENFLDTAKRVTENNAFKQLALMVMASTVPPEEVEELHDLFTSIDEEGDGFITYDQLRQALDISGCEMAKEEVDALLEGLDVTGNGRISYSEFLAGTLESQALVTEMKIREAFDFFDKDHSGTISKDELASVLQQLDMNHCDADELMALADTDHSNGIDFDEFRALLLSNSAPSLLTRMATVAPSGPSGPNLARMSMTGGGAPMLGRPSMGPGGGGAPMLGRASMGMPLLSRASVNARSPSTAGARANGEGEGSSGAASSSGAVSSVASSMDVDTLVRKSMVPPSLARASMGGPAAKHSAVQDKLAEVEMEWRKEGFAGLSRPSVEQSRSSFGNSNGNGISRPSMSLARQSVSITLGRQSINRGTADALRSPTSMATVRE